jgi:hypothetical protein
MLSKVGTGTPDSPVWASRCLWSPEIAGTAHKHLDPGTGRNRDADSIYMRTLERLPRCSPTRVRANRYEYGLETGIHLETRIHAEVTGFDKLLRQNQTSIMRDLAASIALQVEQWLTHHTPFGLRPRKFFRIHARTRIDVTCALKCDRYFHLGHSALGVTLLSCNSSYTSIHIAFPVLNLFQYF